MESTRDYSSLGDRLDFYSIFRDILKNLWAIALIALAAAMITNVAARMNYQRSYSAKAMFAVSRTLDRRHQRAC